MKRLEISPNPKLAPGKTHESLCERYIMRNCFCLKLESYKYNIVITMINYVLSNHYRGRKS